MQVDPRVNGQPLMDPKMIAEVVMVKFWPLDKKPYPDWVDRIPLLKDYKTSDFSTFSSEDGKSTMEHVS